MLPRHARCVLSRLSCNGHSFLLSSYLSRIGRIENPSCGSCRHPSQDISRLILHCPATDSSRRSLFGDPLSLYNLWSRSWRVVQLLAPHGFSPCSILRKGSGSNNNREAFASQQPTDFGIKQRSHMLRSHFFGQKLEEPVIFCLQTNEINHFNRNVHNFHQMWR